MRISKFVLKEEFRTEVLGLNGKLRYLISEPRTKGNSKSV